MRFDVITIFPGLFPGPLGDGIIARASEKGLMDLRVHDLRDYAPPPHRQVDDEPFGGGGGMVLKPEPLFAAVKEVQRRASIPVPWYCPRLKVSDSIRTAPSLWRHGLR